MNNYEPATPRTALGALAIALTLVTFGVLVAVLTSQCSPSFLSLHPM